MKQTNDNDIMNKQIMNNGKENKVEFEEKRDINFSIENDVNVSNENDVELSNENDIELERPNATFQVNDTVMVEERTWAGMNSLGGAGRIFKVYFGN